MQLTGLVKTTLLSWRIEIVAGWLPETVHNEMGVLSRHMSKTLKHKECIHMFHTRPFGAMYYVIFK